MPVGLSPEAVVNVAKVRGLSREPVRKRVIRYRNIGENAYFFGGYIGQLVPHGGAIDATTAVSGALTMSRGIVPAAISASFSNTVSGVIVNRQITPAGITASSAVSGAVTAQKKIVAGTINSSAAVSGSITKLRPVTPASIATSWAVSGSVAALRRVAPASIAASWAVSGLIAALRAITPASVSFNNAVSGAIQFASGPEPIVPTGITASFAVSGAVTIVGSVKPIVPAGGVALRDDFNRADGALGSNWAATAAPPTTQMPEILSNQVKIWPSSIESSAIWVHESFGADQEVSVTLTATPSGVGHLYLFLNTLAAAPTAFTGYLADITLLAPGVGAFHVTLYRCNAGSYTALTGDDAFAPANVGDVFTFRHVGNNLDVIWNSTHLSGAGTWAGAGITDASPLTNPGYIGFGGRDEANVRVDDFSGGTVSVGGGQQITFTNNVSGRVQKAIHPANITASSAVSGSISVLTTFPAIGPASATFSNTVSGTVSRLAAVIKSIVPNDPFPPLLDNFNRADAANLGANYQRATFIAADPIISSNGAMFAGGVEAAAVWDAASFGVDQEVAFTLVAGDTFTTHVYFLLNVQASPDDAYFIDILFGSGTTTGGFLFVQFYRMNASSFTALTGVAGSFPWAAGDTWGAKRTGSLLEVLQNGITVVSWTDVAPLAHGGFVGFGGRGGTNIKIDNLSGGTVSATPRPITFTNSVSGVLTTHVATQIPTPGAITGTFSMSGHVIGPKRLTSNMTATYTIAAPVSPLVISPESQIGLLMMWVHGAFTAKPVVPPVIHATFGVSGLVGKRVSIRGQPTFTTSVSGGIGKLVPAAGGVSTFTTSVSGEIRKQAKIAGVQITWTTSMGATLLVIREFGAIAIVTGRVTQASRGRVFSI